jgi:hypothetical protein
VRYVPLLPALARALRWGKIERTHLLTQGHAIPASLEKWGALIQGSFRAYGTERLLVITLRKKAVPVALALE